MMNDVSVIRAIRADIRGANWLWPPKNYVEVYHREILDGMNAVSRRYFSHGCDFVSKETVVQTVKSNDPATGIHCEATLNEDFPMEEDYEYEQSFRIGKPKGSYRYITHGSDVIAQIQWMQSDIFILKPLDIYMINELYLDSEDIDTHVIAVRDSDGIFRFYTKLPIDREIACKASEDSIYRIIATAGRCTDAGDEFVVSLSYQYERLLPLIASVEEWAFEPEWYRDSEATASENDPEATETASLRQATGTAETDSFRQLNKDIHTALVIVRKWIEGEPEGGLMKHDYDENHDEYILDGERIVEGFFSNPAYGVLSLLRDERPDLLKSLRDGSNVGLTEEAYFVQRTKSRAYGLDTDHGFDEIERRKNSGRQVSLAELL